MSYVWLILYLNTKESCVCQGQETWNMSYLNMDYSVTGYDFMYHILSDDCWLVRWELIFPCKPYLIAVYHVWLSTSAAVSHAGKCVEEPMDFLTSYPQKPGGQQCNLSSKQPISTCKKCKVGLLAVFVIRWPLKQGDWFHQRSSDICYYVHAVFRKAVFVMKYFIWDKLQGIIVNTCICLFEVALGCRHIPQ